MIDRNTLIYKFQRIKNIVVLSFTLSRVILLCLFSEEIVKNSIDISTKLSIKHFKDFTNASVMTTTSTITFSIGIRFPRLIVSYDLNLVIFICLRNLVVLMTKQKSIKCPPTTSTTTSCCCSCS